MAIQRTHKQSDLEKRLKLLNLQLYGKRTEVSSSVKQSDTSSGYKLPINSLKTTISSSDLRSISDVKYLRTDLLKIAILSGAALTFQFLLYYLIQNNLISLNF